jgi:O-antigen/teichoic acid export membrane protein
VIKRHISLSLVYKGLNIFTSLALVTVSLQYLGVELYGVWSTLISLLAWSKLFDVGIGNGLRNKLTEALALDDQELAKKYVSTAYVSLNVLSVVALLVLGTGGAFLNWGEILNIHSLAPKTLYLTFLVTLTFTVLNFATGLISSVCAALQQSSLMVLNQWLSNFFALLFLLLISQLPNRSILLLGFVYGSALVLPNILISWHIFRLHRSLIPSIARFDWSIVHDILGLGVKFFIIQIAVLIYATTDKLVITHFLGPQYVTEYDLVYRLFALPGIITGTINTSLWSGYTDAYKRGDKQWIKRIVTRLNLSMPLMFTATSLLILFGSRIVEIWSSGEVQTTLVFLIFMGINVMLGYWNSIYSNILNGIGKIRLGTVTTVITAILNIYLSIAFGQLLGLRGVILATVITCFMSAIVSPMQVYYWVYAKSKKRSLSLLFS